jgi:cytochrome c oxidase assembly factor CtaG
VHYAEHLCLLGTAWLFWGPILGAARRRPPAPVAVLLLVGTMLPASALGAVLTFAPEPIYPVRVLGPDPLTDQQLAGLAMWVPAGVVYLLAALALFLPWFSSIGAVRGAGRGAYAVPEPVLTAPGEVVR